MCHIQPFLFGFQFHAASWPPQDLSDGRLVHLIGSLQWSWYRSQPLGPFGNWLVLLGKITGKSHRNRGKIYVVSGFLIFPSTNPLSLGMQQAAIENCQFLLWIYPLELVNFHMLWMGSWLHFWGIWTWFLCFDMLEEIDVSDQKCDSRDFWRALLNT